MSATTVTERVAFVCNPGSGRGEDLEALRDALAEGGASVRQFDCEGIEQAASTRPDRLVVAGGDGTIGAAAAAAASIGVPLGVIPTGTANDFARALDLPTDPAAAAVVARDGSQTRPADIAWLGDTPFVNAASAGVAAGAARHARILKGLLGPLAYPLGAARAAVVVRPVDLDVAVDGESLYAGLAWNVLVANSGTFGGGSSVAEANPGDGLLDVVVMEHSSRPRLALYALGLLTGRITDHQGVHHAQGREVTIRSTKPLEFNVDGELVPAGREARLHIDGRVDVLTGRS